MSRRGQRAKYPTEPWRPSEANCQGVVGLWIVGCGLKFEVELWPSDMGKPRPLGVQGAPEAARGGERPIRATSA
jgi:hypothetical protein